MKAKTFANPKSFVFVSIVAAAFIASIFFIQNNPENEISVYDDGIPRAVIIDQLYDEIPNPYFHQKATEYLEGAGYQVDIFTTENVTVDFYKNLPSMNYKFIVVRTHGASTHSSDSVTLFTGERYQEDKYISEQLFGSVKRGAPLQVTMYNASVGTVNAWIVVNETYKEMSIPFNQEIQTTDDYFLVTPKLVDEMMVGKFPDSIMLLGGCNTMEYPSLAKSLIKRGASTVVGWDNTVGDMENDIILLQVLEETLVNNREIKNAVDLVMESYDWGNPHYDAKLKYYSKGNV